MSFRRRNDVIQAAAPSTVPTQDAELRPGTRVPSSDSRTTTSTGTPTLDQLFAGQCGLQLGSCLLVEETGTTDFGGTLLRYFAAEGLVQGHHVHLLGPGDEWRRQLPGLVDESRAESHHGHAASHDKMRIAWRYEALGDSSLTSKTAQGNPVLGNGTDPFCHKFDLSKTLDEDAIRGQLHSMCPGGSTDRTRTSVFKTFLHDVASKLRSSPPHSVHRILVPGLLSPDSYGPAACQPQEVLQFLHGLRGLLRQFPTRATALVGLPVSVYPRASGLTRWMELLFDGVLELDSTALQDESSHGPSPLSNGQGLLRIRSLPVFNELGGGREADYVGRGMSFKLSARNGMVITPIDLSPVDKEESSPQTSTKLDF